MFWHINLRELQAAYLALKIFLQSQINQLFHIQLQIDNQAVVSYINHLGRTHSKLLCQLSLDLWNWSLSRQIHISARYIAGIFNKHAYHVKKVKTNCRMEVEPYSVPKDCCSLQDATERFVCDKSQHSAQKVCVMDTRPSECCNQCVQCPVVRFTVLCVSSLQSNHEMCAKDKKSGRENFASNPSIEIQTLVPLLYDQPLLLPNSETTLLPPSNQKALKPN